MDLAVNDEIVMNSESGLACPALTGAGRRVDPLLNGFGFRAADKASFRGCCCQPTG
jgi:hypothetical protein